MHPEIWMQVQDETIKYEAFGVLMKEEMSLKA